MKLFHILLTISLFLEPVKESESGSYFTLSGSYYGTRIRIRIHSTFSGSWSYLNFTFSGSLYGIRIRNPNPDRSPDPDPFHPFWILVWNPNPDLYVFHPFWILVRNLIRIRIHISNWIWTRFRKNIFCNTSFRSALYSFIPPLIFIM
jgi:hypothetical protein